MKNKKIRMTFAMILAVMAMGQVIPVLAENTEKTVAETTSENSTETEQATENKNERKAKLTVVSISGNKLTYYEEEIKEDTETEAETENITEDSSEEIVEKVSIAPSSEKKEDTGVSDETSEGGFPGGRTVPEGFSAEDMPEGFSGGRNSGEGESGERTDRGNFSEGNMPEGFSGGNMPGGFSGGRNSGEGESGERTDRGNFSEGNMPEGFSGGNMPEGFSGGNMPEGFSGGNMPGGFSGGGSRSDGFRQGAQNNVKTVYLPVSVPVHVGESEVRTFTILRAGDTLEATLMTDDDGEEVITEIWIKKVSEDS